MAKLTTIQIDKYNAQCKNGFKFDIRDYIFNKEKTLFKFINLQADNILRVTLLYCQSKQGQTPTLHLHKGVPSGEFYSFSGLGQYITIGEAQKTKKFNVLIALTEKLIDEYILSLHDEKITSKATTL